MDEFRFGRNAHLFPSCSRRCSGSIDPATACGCHRHRKIKHLSLSRTSEGTSETSLYITSHFNSMETATNNLVSAISKVWKEVERVFCFTDVPYGTMEYKRTPTTHPESYCIEQDVTSLLKEMERTLCFSDLKDSNASAQRTTKVCNLILESLGSCM